MFVHARFRYLYTCTVCMCGSLCLCMHVCKHLFVSAYAVLVSVVFNVPWLLCMCRQHCEWRAPGAGLWRHSERPLRYHQTRPALHRVRDKHPSLILLLLLLYTHKNHSRGKSVSSSADDMLQLYYNQSVCFVFSHSVMNLVRPKLWGKCFLGYFVGDCKWECSHFAWW